MGDISQAERFTTRENGEVIGVGMEGPITGKGAGLKEAGNGFIVIDDPMKPGDAISRLKVEAANFWFTNTLLSRRNSPHVPVIICAQRVGRNDLCGYVLRNFGAEVLHIKIPVFDRRGRNIMPETKSNEELQALKLADNFSFQAQFMQEPIAKGGNIIKTDQFKFYADAPESMRFDWKCVTCDTAQKTKEANDYTVMQCWGCLAGAAYLIDQIRGKVEAPDLITLAMEFWRRHDGDGMRQFFIEDKVSGTGLIQTLIRERIPVQPLQRSKDKFMRLSDALPYITAGAVYLPKGAAWLPAFLAECEDFRADMSHDHDDQVDCMVDGILAVKGIGVSILDVI
jgi:predicted phage terminase large subunit-like protein